MYVCSEYMSEKQSYVQSLQSIDLQTIYEFLSPENNENEYNYGPTQSFYTQMNLMSTVKKNNQRTIHVYFLPCIVIAGV